MDATELRAALARMNLSQRAAARELDIDERTMRRYAAGELPVPLVVEHALAYLELGVVPRQVDGERAAEWWWKPLGGDAVLLDVTVQLDVRPHAVRLTVRDVKAPIGWRDQGGDLSRVRELGPERELVTWASCKVTELEPGANARNLLFETARRLTIAREPLGG